MSAAAIPALRTWTATRTYGQVAGHSLHVTGLGQFTIVPVFATGALIPSGWALKVSPSLPYGATAKPYQLDQVNDLKKAGQLVKSATAYANDKALQLKVKQACLNA